MAPGKAVRIGGYSAMWGDIPMASKQLVDHGKCHYLIGDYLAETTMAILAKARKKNAKMGYAVAIVQMLKDNLKGIREQGIKVVCNAGGMNPVACRDALVEACAKAKVDLKIGAVVGDDASGLLPELRAEGAREMFTGEPVPSGDFTSANAYLGAKPIAAALGLGCDVVVTGRCVDSALVLGILMHEFGWGDDEYDKLSMGTCCGHLLECSAQSTGGLFTDWRSQRWDNMGYPIAEVSSDGSFTLTKPSGTDGVVCFGSVAEQLVYEIQDPGAYQCPDVVCDFTSVSIEEVGKDIVRVTGGRGLPPTSTFKVCCTLPDGYAGVQLMLIVGEDAAAKARRTHETILARARAKLQKLGAPDYTETRFEAIGAGHFDPRVQEGAATEVVGKIGLKHAMAKAIDLYRMESICSGVSMAQGTTTFGSTGVSGKSSEVLRVFSLLVDKSRLPASEVLVAGSEQKVAVPVPCGGGYTAAARPPPATPAAAAAAAGETERVRLSALCWARSGDKGNVANVALIARRPEYLPLVRSLMTEDLVKEYFVDRVKGSVTRYDLPGIRALNFVCDDALGGGGMATLHSDPLAKTFGQVLLLMYVDVPKSWGLGTKAASRL